VIDMSPSMAFTLFPAPDATMRIDHEVTKLTHAHLRRPDVPESWTGSYSNDKSLLGGKRFMRSKSFDGMACSIAGVLEAIGDRWAVLILRDLSLGLSRYDDLRRSTGITNATLSDRLKHS